MNRKRRKTDKTGHSAPDQYAIIDYSFLKSDAFRQLSGPAVKIFLEFRSRYNGSNNGRITLSWDEITHLLAMGKSTVKRALNELQNKGFIRLIVKGRWFGRKASEWELTMLPRNGHAPTHEWKVWKADKPLKEAKKIEARYQGGFVACFEGSVSEPKR